MIDCAYTAALDTSSAHASFVVRSQADQALIIADHETPVGRRSAGLMGRLLALLGQHGVDLAEIGRWSIGMGPGSFTGIRVGAALVKGICAGTGACYRGVPSSLALASQAGLSPVTILHDGRRDEVIATSYALEHNQWRMEREAAAVSIAELKPDCHYAMLGTDRALPDVRPQLGERLHVLSRLEANALLDAPAWPWPATAAEAETSTDPIYVRPAVFVEPQEVLPPAVVARLLDADANPVEDTAP